MGHSLEPIGDALSNPEPAGFVGALAHGSDTQTRWVCLTRWVLDALLRGSLEP